RASSASIVRQPGQRGGSKAAAGSSTSCSASSTFASSRVPSSSSARTRLGSTWPQSARYVLTLFGGAPTRTSMSSAGASAMPMSASSSCGPAALSSIARSAGSTAVSFPAAVTATSLAPEGPGISILTLSGRRKATSARERPRSSAPRTDTRRLPDQECAARAFSATPGAGGRTVAQAAAVSSSAAASSGRGRRGPLLLGLKRPLSLTDLGLHAGSVELTLVVLALDRLLPVAERFGHAAALGDDVAQMVEDDRIARIALERAADGLLGRVQPVQAIERPAEAVLVGRALRLDRDRLLDERVGLFHADVAVGVHVAQVVQHRRGLGLDLQGLAEDALGRVVLLLPLEHGAELEERPEALGVGRQGLA